MLLGQAEGIQRNVITQRFPPLGEMIWVRSLKFCASTSFSHWGSNGAGIIKPCYKAMQLVVGRAGSHPGTACSLLPPLQPSSCEAAVGFSKPLPKPFALEFETPSTQHLEDHSSPLGESKQ